MSAINPQTELENELMAAVAELVIENRKLKKIIEAQKESDKSRAEKVDLDRARVEKIKREVLGAAISSQAFTDSNAFIIGKMG